MLKNLVIQFTGSMCNQKVFHRKLNSQGKQFQNKHMKNNCHNRSNKSKENNNTFEFLLVPFIPFEYWCWANVRSQNFITVTSIAFCSTIIRSHIRQQQPVWWIPSWYDATARLNLPWPSYGCFSILVSTKTQEQIPHNFALSKTFLKLQGTTV